MNVIETVNELRTYRSEPANRKRVTAICHALERFSHGTPMDARLTIDYLLNLDIDTTDSDAQIFVRRETADNQGVITLV